jgi:hypothetical protein
MAPIPGIAGPGAPYPQWGVAVGSPGQHVTKVSNAIAKTVMESVSFPSKVYFFTSEQAATNWVNGNGGQTFLPGTQTALNDANAGINTATSAAGTAVDVAGFLSRLSNPHTWLRVAEAVVGIAFLIIGLNALLHNPAGKVAGVAAKAAVL